MENTEAESLSLANAYYGLWVVTGRYNSQDISGGDIVFASPNERDCWQWMLDNDKIGSFRYCQVRIPYAYRFEVVTR